ncbi:sugar ABC transporter substrate-binding protein [Rhizobium ecuadorense]|uniref:sugar ABC transporter substrate-binding protein n=1 Tax=Rhizobium ecuadorense TaxID=1671795 RepID=UPI00067385D7|nr:sugar ABC transporter substrate-binding protein [Rhizobium ecuadorense]
MRNLVKCLKFGVAASILVLAAGKTSAQEITLGYVVGTLANQYNVATAKGFEDAAKEAGVQTVVLDPQGSVEKQTNAIDQLLAQRVDGIAFLPLDSILAQTYVDKIDNAGIPAISIAGQVGDPTKVDLRDVYRRLVALVSTDDVRAGEVAGELAATMLPSGRKAKIAVVEGAPGYAVLELRSQGFRNALDAAAANYEIVASEPTDWTPEKGEEVCKNFLATTSDIDLIFSQADDMAIGCARAINAAHSSAKLVATGGGSKLGNDAIAAGDIDASVCTQPAFLGRLMFQELFKAATKKDTLKARFVTYDLTPITKDNLAECPPEW